MGEAIKVKRRRGYTRVSSKNQVTLPADVLAATRISPGDELRVEVDGDGRLVLTRMRDALEEVIGSMPGLELAVDLQAQRDQWER